MNGVRRGLCAVDTRNYYCCVTLCVAAAAALRTKSAELRTLSRTSPIPERSSVRDGIVRHRFSFFPNAIMLKNALWPESNCINYHFEVRTEAVISNKR